MPRMKRARVYFAPQILGVVENIQVNTGIKTYTDVISLILERYGEDFINSYNNFRYKHQFMEIDLSKLEGFRE